MHVPNTYKISILGEKAYFLATLCSLNQYSKEFQWQLAGASANVLPYNIIYYNMRQLNM